MVYPFVPLRSFQLSIVIVNLSAQYWVLLCHYIAGSLILHVIVLKIGVLFPPMILGPEVAYALAIIEVV
ncbi:hypothetical protein VNO77_42488 [Canavalia gladiata]|uniref:Uncharacterized protein n=1 Tax=Canavalia gladiata TaxID=3824 RepID=A0AAN9JSD1_CANGL